MHLDDLDSKLFNQPCCCVSDAMKMWWTCGNKGILGICRKSHRRVHLQFWNGKVTSTQFKQDCIEDLHGICPIWPSPHSLVQLQAWTQPHWVLPEPRTDCLMQPAIAEGRAWDASATFAKRWQGIPTLRDSKQTYYYSVQNILKCKHASWLLQHEAIFRTWRALRCCICCWRCCCSCNCCTRAFSNMEVPTS